MNPSELSALAKSSAASAGFELCGVAGLPGESHEFEFFREWIAAGHAGEMEYLKTRGEFGSLRRTEPGETAPWARSVIVCGLNYDSDQPYSVEVAGDKSRGWIARYAWGEDYHAAV